MLQNSFMNVNMLSISALNTGSSEKQQIHFPTQNSVEFLYIQCKIMLCVPLQPLGWHNNSNTPNPEKQINDTKEGWAFTTLLFLLSPNSSSHTQITNYTLQFCPQTLGNLITELVCFNLFGIIRFFFLYTFIEGYFHLGLQFFKHTFLSLEGKQRWHPNIILTRSTKKDP